MIYTNISSIGIAVIAWTAYVFGLGVYHLYFYSTAKVPGPKLAAFTTWYQCYWDVWLRVEEMHAQYGPIIRINPHEISIKDPEYIDEIFSGPKKKRETYTWVGRGTTLTESTLSTISHDLHRNRRAALNPYFSKANSIDKLSRADYNIYFYHAMHSFFETSHWMIHFPWLGTLAKSLPPSVTTLLLPGLSWWFQLERQWKAQIEEIKDAKDHELGKNTIFYGLLKSSLPESEKSSSRIQQEAQLLISAGQDTTGFTLAAINFELLANSDKLKKLKVELALVISDPDKLPTISQVENLPNLSAAVHETLRLHPGFFGHMSRVSPEKPLYYNDHLDTRWIISAGMPFENPRLDRYPLHLEKVRGGALEWNLLIRNFFSSPLASFKSRTTALASKAQA